jgi:hypothetical protein
MTVYTDDARSIGQTVETSPTKDISTVAKTEQPHRQSLRPTREQEFKLLLASAYLVEYQGKVAPYSNDKIFQARNGITISRNSSGLSISRQGDELVFDSHNATVKNTFDSKQINHLIQSTTQLGKQFQQQHHSHSQTQGYSIDF